MVRIRIRRLHLGTYPALATEQDTKPLQKDLGLLSRTTSTKPSMANQNPNRNQRLVVQDRFERQPKPRQRKKQVHLRGDSKYHCNNLDRQRKPERKITETSEVPSLNEDASWKNQTQLQHNRTTCPNRNTEVKENANRWHFSLAPLQQTNNFNNRRWDPIP